MLSAFPTSVSLLARYIDKKSYVYDKLGGEMKTLDDILEKIYWEGEQYFRGINPSPEKYVAQAKQEIAELLPSSKEVRADMSKGQRLQYYPNVGDCEYNQALKDVRKTLGLETK